MKKLLAVIFSVILAALMLPVAAKADGMAYLTLDMTGGTLNNGIPDGWEDVGNGQYRKQYETSQWIYFAEEWEGYEPVKEGFLFKGWNTGYYVSSSIRLQNNTTCPAEWDELVNVCVDLNGGTVPSEDIPEGWTLIGGTTDKYSKQFTSSDYSMSITNEWADAIPVYDGFTFVRWDSDFTYPSSEAYTITAVKGAPRDVTVDFSPFTVISATSDWTKVSDSVYKKQYPEGSEIWQIKSEITSAFTVEVISGTDIYKKSVSCSDTYVAEGTTLYAEKETGYTVTITVPDNAICFINNEEVLGSADFLVPSSVSVQNRNGNLEFTDSYIGRRCVQICGKNGYALEKYIYSATEGEVPSYSNTMSENTSFTGVISAGVQTYPIWFDGNQFSDAVLEYEDGKVVYNPATKTLTLNGLNYTSANATLINFATDITINVASDCTIGATTGGINGSGTQYLGVITGEPYNSGWYNTGSYSLTIKGDGKLTVNLGDTSTGTYTNLYGIVAKELTIEADTEILEGTVAVSGYYSPNITIIAAEKTTVNGADVTINSGTVNSTMMGSTSLSLIYGALVMKNNAHVSLAIPAVGDSLTPHFIGDGYSYKVDLISGTLQLSSYFAGGTVALAKPANIVSISGATEGAAATDTTFTMASETSPLILVAKEIVNISATAENYKYGQTNKKGYTNLSVEDHSDLVDTLIITYYSETETAGVYETTGSATVPTAVGNYRVEFKIPDTSEGFQGSTTVDFTISKADVDAPSVSDAIVFDYDNETIAPKTGYELSTGTGTAFDSAKITSAVAVDFTKTYYVRKAADDNHNASAETTYTPARLTAPAASSFTKTNESEKDEADGSLSGITAAMEYSTDGGETWTDGPATLTGLSTETVKIRFKGASASFRSEILSVVFEQGPVKFNVTFKGYETVRVASGDTVNKPDTPEKTGSTFCGWFADESFSNAWNFEKDPVTKDMTLYPFWVTEDVSHAVLHGIVSRGDSTPAEGISVELYHGTQKIAATVTDETGSYSFGTVITMAYNIITTDENGKKTTVLIDIPNTQTDLAQDISLPEENASSQIIKEGETTSQERSNIKNILVGGLNEVASALSQLADGAVTVDFRINASPNVSNDKINSLKKVAGENQILEIFDLSLLKTVNGGAAVDIGSSNDVMLTIRIPFDFTGVNIDSIKIIREHGTIQTLKRNPGAGEEGFTIENNSLSGYYFDTNGEKDSLKNLSNTSYLVLHVYQFSTYAVSYELSPVPQTGVKDGLPFCIAMLATCTTALFVSEFMRRKRSKNA